MIVGVEKNGFTASLFSYNGMNESDDPTDDDNDTINGFGAALAYSYEQEDRGFNAGIAWGNNIGDGGTITDYLEADKDGDPTTADEVYSIADQVPGLALHFGGSYKAFSWSPNTSPPWTASLPQKSPLAPTVPSPLPGTANWPTPPPFWTRKRSLLLATRNRGGGRPGAAGNRYIAATSMNVFEGTTVSLEYYFDEDYAVSDGVPTKTATGSPPA